MKLSFKKLVLVSSLLVLVLAGCSTSQTKDVNLLLGNPSNAKPDITSPNNYLIEKPQYALSYNRDRGITNWVSWQLSKKWLGNIQRQNDFRLDSGLPADWYRVKPEDYRGSKFQKGHLSASSDRTKNILDNSATFLMTNIIPQAAQNNEGPWLGLEKYSRELVRDGKELYIVAGGVGNQTTIGKGKIVVPERLWKAIVVVDRSEAKISDINFGTRIIAVDMPNKNNVALDWHKYITSVNKLEAATGYDFLSNLPIWLQIVLESKVDGASYFNPDWRLMIVIIGLGALCILLGIGLFKLVRRSLYKRSARNL